MYGFTVRIIFLCYCTRGVQRMKAQQLADNSREDYNCKAACFHIRLKHFYPRKNRSRLIDYLIHNLLVLLHSGQNLESRVDQTSKLQQNLCCLFLILISS